MEEEKRYSECSLHTLGPAFGCRHVIDHPGHLGADLFD